MRRQAFQKTGLFKNLFRRDREAVGNIGRAVEDFEQVMAERAFELARGPAPRRKLDPAEAGMAFRTDDVAFFHRPIMPVLHNRSTTAALTLGDLLATYLATHEA
jgi:hypothetical protein